MTPPTIPGEASGDESFGQLLRRYRVAAGMTQEQLAERAEVSTRGLAYLESDRRSPHRSTVTRLVAALGLDSGHRAAFEVAARGPRDGDAEDDGVPARPVTPLVGRMNELNTAVALLRLQDVRLLTLTGTGGVGKTRLALELIERVESEFADGLVSVWLERVRDPGLVLSTLARALSIREERRRPLIKTIADRLQRQEVLLFLDNFEQVLPAAPVLVELLSAAPGLKTLVTSRSPMQVADEQELVVPALTVPDRAHTQLEAVGQSSAVRLFVQRAQRVRHDFVLDHQNVDAVVEVCRRLGGLPLAIELAVPNLRMMAVDELAHRVEHVMALPGAYRGTSRHRTLEATLDWSYKLLSASERRLFRWLGVFAGGFTLDTIESVSDMPNSLELLTGLVRQSLISPAFGTGETRYWTLEPVREFAQSQLSQSSDADYARRRHADYFLGLVKKADSEVAGAVRGRWLERLDVELPNIREALRFWREADKSKGLQLSCSLWRFWWLRGYTTEGRAYLIEFLEGEDVPARLRSRALGALGILALWQGEATPARHYFEHALTLAQQEDGAPEIAGAMTGLGRVALEEERYDEAIAWLEHSLRIGQELKLSPEFDLTYTYLGWAAFFVGDYQRAEEVLREGLERARRAGDRDGEARVTWSLAEVALEKGDLASARHLLDESLRIDADLGYKHGVAMIFDGLADLAAFKGQHLTAMRLSGASAALQKETATVAPAGFQLRHERRIAIATNALGEDAAASAFAEGERMAMSAAIAIAIEMDG